MCDLINKNKLIEEIKENDWMWLASKEEKEMVIHLIKRQPGHVSDTNVGNKWIPCSERLPEKTAYYLVTIKGFKRPMYAWFMKTEKTWQYLNSQVLIDNVVAWMPLPPIYKGE